MTRGDNDAVLSDSTRIPVLPSSILCDGREGGRVCRWRAPGGRERKVGMRDEKNTVANAAERGRGTRPSSAVLNRSTGADVPCNSWLIPGSTLWSCLNGRESPSPAEANAGRATGARCW